jgi:hypothetical protein
LEKFFKDVELMAEEDEDDFETWFEKNTDNRDSICEISVIEQWATWLCDSARQANGKPLSLGSIKDILSAAKTVFNELHPQNTIFKGVQEWYTITTNQNVKGLPFVMLATFLMYYEEFKNDCLTKYNISDRPNIVISLFEEKSKEYFTQSECFEFGKIIRDTWECRNKIFVSKDDSTGNTLMLERLQDECLKIRAENRELKSQLIDVQLESRKTNSILLNQNSKLTAITDMLLKLTGGTPQSSPTQLSSNKSHVRHFFPSEPESRGQKRSREDSQHGGSGCNEEVQTMIGSGSTEQAVEMVSDIVDTETITSHIVKPAVKGCIVYQFGMGTNKTVSNESLGELLILSIDKGFIYQESQKGKKTVQNFECYTEASLLKDITARADDSRVRSALDFLNAEVDKLDIAQKNLLYKKKPDGDHTKWNQDRKAIMVLVQEAAMNTLWEKEKVLAAKSNSATPKRVANKIGTFLSRYDSYRSEMKKIENGKQGNAITTWTNQSSGSSSSSSSGSEPPPVEK